MKTPRVIGVSGKARAGKDVIAHRLAGGWGFERLSFAEGLRLELVERMPRTLLAIHDLHCDCGHGVAPTNDRAERCLEHMLYVSKPKGIRELLQEYGTEVRRGDDPEYWTKLWRESVMRLSTQGVVVADVRFPNEAAAVLSMGGALWRVERPGCVGGSHESETALDSWGVWDAVIHNNGSVDDLWAKVDTLMSRTSGDAS